MAVIILGTLMIMVGYFLLLYAGVGLIQDKRFFSSAPKENLAVIPYKKERFRVRIFWDGCLEFLRCFFLPAKFFLARGMKSGIDSPSAVSLRDI